MWLDTLQPYASTRPWMFTAGNHEDNFNFTFFNEKFRMPNYPYANNNYYSVDVGLVHFISVNMHFYDDCKTSDQTQQAKQQMLEWLESDLKRANANRKQVPWIIASGHKALYCSSTECETYNQVYSDFDHLFYKYGLDVFLGAHKH